MKSKRYFSEMTEEEKFSLSYKEYHGFSSNDDDYLSQCFEEEFLTEEELDFY